MLASCTTSFSVYVSLSKNSFWGCLTGLSLKADAKVRLIFHSSKLFERKMYILHKKNGDLT